MVEVNVTGTAVEVNMSSLQSVGFLRDVPSPALLRLEISILLI